MTNWEKVVANVTGIVSDMQEEVDEWKDYSDSELSHGLICDCDWWYKTLQTLKDALALLKAQEQKCRECGEATSKAIQELQAKLKAQEPRVMTPEEVVGNIVLERDVILWFEFHDSVKELNAKDIEYNDYLCDDDMPTLYEPNLKWQENGYLDGVIVFEYNDVFRCWTSRPTDEQRQTVKWDGDT